MSVPVGLTVWDMMLFLPHVTSLYTNTPHTDGLMALRHFLDLRTDDDDLPTKFINEMAEFYF